MNGERILVIYLLLAIGLWIPKIVPRAWAAAAPA
jgi:hypothetical protein